MYLNELLFKQINCQTEYCNFYTWCSDILMMLKATSHSCSLTVHNDYQEWLRKINDAAIVLVDCIFQSS
jgi:hypothetical protein